MKAILFLALGVLVSAAVADEIAFPADFWDKVNARLADIESNHTTGASGETVDALDTTFTTSYTQAWSNDFFTWTWSEDESDGAAVDFTPTGTLLLIR